jgi:hypothetical protein
VSTSPSQTLATVQLQLYCAQAHAAWARVDALDAEHKTNEKQLRDTQHERLWAQTPKDHARLDATINALTSQLNARTPHLIRARDAALVASERAAAFGWGIRLGRRYLVTRDGIAVEMLVQNLRPMPNSQGPGRMLATGEAGGRPAMVVLGRDVLEIAPAGPENVIDISARLAARRGKP